jgi:hypothetical protein
MTEATICPITPEYPLRCMAEHAFATYTGRIGDWWTCATRRTRRRWRQ